MRIKGAQDLGTGLLFVAIGLAALWIGADYPMGTAQRPGTGVLPAVLAWCLIGTGGLLGLKAALVEGPRLTGWAWRPAIMVTLAAVAFALLIDRAGLVAAMVVSMTLAALGTPETRWREYAFFLLIMIAIGIVLFIKGLGMPISIWPPGLYDWAASALGLLRAR
jgi:Tripartite tricarboxylate transporter TctB family